MKVTYLQLLFLSLGWAVFVHAVDDEVTDTVVVTPDASIVGLRINDYEQFLGIPFANPPVGDLRFTDPVIKPLWSGLFEAKVPPKACVQQNIMLKGLPVEGDEDCLYLNIFRPRKDEALSKVPVIFYIHGGGFFFGSSNPLFTGPDIIMARASLQPVILVTIQYRLSALGFLSTGDSSSPGNFGFKDQRVALQWIKENIAAFGGDPDAVTIMGQSAGAASVGLHMLSPLSKPLFHKAIMMSGSAMGPYIFPTKDPLTLARRHAAALNIENAESLSTVELVAEMRKKDATEIISTVESLKSFDIDPLTIYRLVVEDASIAEPFMTEDPREIMKRGDFANVPLLGSLVEVEGAIRAAAFIVDAALKEKLNANLTGILPTILELDSLTGEERDNFVTKIIDRYIPGGQLTDENQKSFIQMYTDRSFVYPHYKEMQFMFTKPDVQISSYHFNYRGTNSFSSFFANLDPRDFGVVHCDDLIYLFKSALFPISGKDDILSRLFSTFIVDFVEGKNQVQTRLEDNRLGPYAHFGKNENGDIERSYDRYYETKEVIDFWDQAKEY